MRQSGIFVLLASLSLAMSIDPLALTEPAAAAVAEPGRFEFSQPHMGTTCRIVLYAVDAQTAKRGSDAAFARIAALDRMLSDYKDDSELMRLCQQSGGPPVGVSRELFKVLAEAQRLAKESDGAFDVTVGPVIRLWRRARRQRQLPGEKRLAEARSLVGFDKVVLDEKAGTVLLSKPGMLLDLGGIAKGHAADEAMAVLLKYHITSALVAAGGDIVVSAPPPGSEGWAVGILPLDEGNKQPPRQLVLRNAAVSTSGDREQFVEINGVRYSHIIDPRTGQALTGRRSVTVVAKRGTESDSLATAVCVLGAEKGLALVDRTEGAAASIVLTTKEDTRSCSSRRWSDLRFKD